MANLSRETMEVRDEGPVEDRLGTVGDTTIEFVTFRATVDGTPLLKGLPDDKCHCPHWGYVFRGSMSFVVDGVETVYNAGDAFYIPAVGHTPGATADTEILMFSPTEELAITEAAMRKNMQTMMGAHQR